jgi:hypothetical protein
MSRVSTSFLSVPVHPLFRTRPEPRRCIPSNPPPNHSTALPQASKLPPIYGFYFWTSNEARGSRTFHVIEPFRISCGCPDSPDPLCAYDMTDIPFQHLTSNWSWLTRYFHCMSLPSKSACGLLSSHESPAPSSLLSCPDERGVLGRVSSTLCPLAEDESCDRDAV